MRKSCIPNVFTFINLSLGIFSIMSVINNNLVSSSICILLAGLIDRYDGRIARFLNVSSDLGKELDSLADLVSFGVAPSVLIYILFDFANFGPKGLLGTTLLIVFPICGAYRLARFNTMTFDGVFTGIPITIAGCLVALFALFNVQNQVSIYIPCVIMIIFSYLMVSKFKLKKF